jgi:hypothetical protein
MAIWKFLGDPANCELLSWIGGLVVVCGGLWTVFTFFHKPAGAAGDGGARIMNDLTGWPLVALVAALAGAVVLVAALSGPRVTARNGNVGIGGNNSGPINVK